MAQRQDTSQVLQDASARLANDHEQDQEAFRQAIDIGDQEEALRIVRGKGLFRPRRVRDDFQPDIYDDVEPYFDPDESGEEVNNWEDYGDSDAWMPPTGNEPPEEKDPEWEAYNQAIRDGDDETANQLADKNVSFPRNRTNYYEYTPSHPNSNSTYSPT
ncbi:MAG: hypothetical protein M1836_002631 [Candelina mexicana]|nr:MAG: hypothetical protein M1836_002631 [Candelina mexicana]